MKGIVWIVIFILVILIGWKYFRTLLKNMWSRYREEFTITNVEDPVFLFRLIFDIAEYNANSYLNHNVPYKDSITDKEKRQDFLDKIITEGVTFISRIVKVQTSCNLPENHISGLRTTGLTTIICDRDHYCLPGANVTIKGIPGLDGYYKNGVSIARYANEKRDSMNRVDVDYELDARGSMLGLLHSFHLIKDTSTLDSIREGVDKGYMKNISSESSVEVFHKVYRSMTYNEWLSSVLSTMCYLYGPNPSMMIFGYAKDLYGTVVDDWSQIALNSSYNLKCQTKNSFRFEPMQGFVTNNLRYVNRAPAQKKIYSLFNKFWINDPYNIDEYFEKYFLPYITDDYDLIGTPDVYGPSISLNIIPILHYLKEGTVKNIYWGLTGSGEKTREQSTICRTLNMFNADERSVSGGTRLIGKLFDWVNPYDYKKVKEKRDHPDPQTWIILGGTNTEDGRDRKNNYLNYYCGMIKEEFTKGKKVGYIYMANFLFTTTIANGSANYFSPPFPSEFEKYKDNDIMKAQYSVISILSPMMYYLVTENKCDSIILDIRGNDGGDYPVCLASFFGDIRSGIDMYMVKNDTGYSFPSKIIIPQMSNEFSKVWVNLASTFPGCVFKGDSDHTKKVILLLSHGTSTSIVNNFFGDKGDGSLGSNTYCSIIGNKSLGLITKTLSNGINIPTISSKIKYSLEFSFSAGNIRLFSVPEGPLFNKPIYSDGFWNQVLGSAEIPSSLKPVSGGTSLRNDMSLLYYSIGILPSPEDLFIRYTGYADPITTDPTTWKDPWLEQSIRESLSEVLHIDIETIYPSFHLDKKSSGLIIDNRSFAIETGQSMFTTQYWDISQFNMQLNFIIENGVIQYNPRGSDDKGNTLIPFGTNSESIFAGFFNKEKKPQYGISISSELYTDGVYAIGFFVGKVMKQFNSKISFPCSVSILIQGNSQIYFTVNGYHMYQGNVTVDADTDLVIGATCSSNLKDKKSFVLFKEIYVQ